LPSLADLPPLTPYLETAGAEADLA